MAGWYNDAPEAAALRAAWGEYPGTPDALQAWPGFVQVTSWTRSSTPSWTKKGHRPRALRLRPGHRFETTPSTGATARQDGRHHPFDSKSALSARVRAPARWTW